MVHECLSDEALSTQIVLRLTEYVIDVASIGFGVAISAATGQRHKLVVQIGVLNVAIEAVIEHLFHLHSQFAHLFRTHGERRLGQEAEEEKAC